jgi:hypothetical protein
MTNPEWPAVDKTNLIKKEQPEKVVDIKSPEKKEKWDIVGSWRNRDEFERDFDEMKQTFKREPEKIFYIIKNEANYIKDHVKTEYDHHNSANLDDSENTSDMFDKTIDAAYSQLALRIITQFYSDRGYGVETRALLKKEELRALENKTENIKIIQKAKELIDNKEFRKVIEEEGDIELFKMITDYSINEFLGNISDKMTDPNDKKDFEANVFKGGDMAKNLFSGLRKRILPLILEKK